MGQTIKKGGCRMLGGKKHSQRCCRLGIVGIVTPASTENALSVLRQHLSASGSEPRMGAQTVHSLYCLVAHWNARPRTSPSRQIPRRIRLRRGVLRKSRLMGLLPNRPTLGDCDKIIHRSTTERRMHPLQRSALNFLVQTLGLRRSEFLIVDGALGLDI
jgi:hypothetical protein